MSSDARRIQGEDPKGEVFKGLSAVLYAMDTSMSYEVSSLGTVHCANVLSGGLRGKRVADLGCGHGNTTLMLGQFGPREIVAVDNSPAMTELMRLIHQHIEIDIGRWLVEKGAEWALGANFTRTAERLIARREQWLRCLFTRSGGSLEILTEDYTKLMTEFDHAVDPPVRSYSIDPFDVVVANNVLHWAINQRRAQLKKDLPVTAALGDNELRRRAITEVFTAIAGYLKPGGTLAIMSPKDFVYFDSDLQRDADLEANTMATHPLFIRVNALFNQRLKERFGIARDVPKTTKLFPVSEIAGYLEAAGLEPAGFFHQENPWQGDDPVLGLEARMPMWLGQINIPAEEKVKLTAEVAAEARATLTDEERFTPVFIQYFYICGRKF